MSDDEIGILIGFVDEIELQNDFICIIIEVERGIIIGIISGKIVVIAH